VGAGGGAVGTAWADARAEGARTAAMQATSGSRIRARITAARYPPRSEPTRAQPSRRRATEAIEEVVGKAVDIDAAGSDRADER
jgi:hypothetical protein